MGQAEKDEADLKQARQELEWKEAEVYRLELAIEFGRCKQCNEPLDYRDKVMKTETCVDYPNCIPEPVTSEPTSIKTAKIKIGEIFEVESKKYVILYPTTAEQNCNDHGQIVCLLTEIE